MFHLDRKASNIKDSSRNIGWNIGWNIGTFTSGTLASFSRLILSKSTKYFLKIQMFHFNVPEFFGILVVFRNSQTEHCLTFFAILVMLS